MYHLAAEVDRLEKHAADSATGWGTKRWFFSPRGMSEFWAGDRGGKSTKYHRRKGVQNDDHPIIHLLFWCLTRTFMTFIAEPVEICEKEWKTHHESRRLWITGVAKIEFRKYPKIPNDQLDPIVFDWKGKKLIYLMVIDSIDFLNKDEGQSSQDSVKFMNNKNISFLLLETTQCKTIRSIDLQLITFSKW